MNINENLKGTLLIIEDEPSLLEAVVEMLTPFADKILTAVNGAEALKVIKANTVDAVLTDIKMPIMTGLQFLAEIRSQYIQTPVIVLTGFGDLNSVKEALRLDATDFLEKPFERTVLESTVSRALKYGMNLRIMEAEVDLLYKNSSAPKAEIDELKRIKKITQGMKLGFSAYTKK